MPNLPDLIEKYQQILKSEGFQADSEQEKAVQELQRLLSEISTKPKFNFFRKKQTPKGVYLHGGVGRGKSMLMDIFFEEAPNTIKKRRIHFHEFMIETHDWLHAHRGDEMDDLLSEYASHVSKNIRLLCFDEFHVTDVADAMILGRLFTALFDKGMIVVATSNWRPGDLYEGGLQRELFLPFIALLKQQMAVVHLDSDKDYRQIADADQDVYYFSPLNKETQAKVDALFRVFSDDAPLQQDQISIKGRDVTVKNAGNCARFTFAELCEQPLGAEDYIAIAARYDTVFVENIPLLQPKNRNEAKRFILLIDCLYEAKCRLVLSAEKQFDKLYQGDDHAFEFDRTISRLMEMQSKAYHEKRMAG